MKVSKSTLGLAAEFAVASELGRRNIYAQPTLGLQKRTDLLIFGENNKQLINHRIGFRKRVSPDTATGSDQTFVGIVHTHPPHRETKGVAFGEADFEQMIEDGNIISLLQTGSYLLALVRTQATPSVVDGEVLRRQMSEAEDEAKASGATTLQALLLANLKLCEIYGLAFYYGYAPGPLERM